MTNTVDLSQGKTIYAENLFPKFCNFDADLDFVVASGTGTVGLVTNESYYGIYTSEIAQGNGSLYITNNDYQNTDLIVNSQAAKDSFTNTEVNYSLISAMFYKRSVSDVIIHLEVYYQGALTETLVFDLSSYPVNTWVRLGQTLFTDVGDFTFRWIIKANPLHPTNAVGVFVDGFCWQTYDKFTDDLNYAYMPANDIIIDKTQVIDLPSIASGAIERFTLTMDGAKTTDLAPQMSIPTSLTSLNLIYSCYVSDDDEVTFMAYNPTGSAIDAPSASVTFKITR